MEGVRQYVWSGKPYMRKTLVKFLLLFALLTFLLLPLWAAAPSLFLGYITIVPALFAFYYYWKSAHTYYVTERSVLITRSWVFGTYEREITLDRVHDVHVQQGILARAFNCGSLVFVTMTGLEVGHVATGVGRDVWVAAARPRLLRTPGNAFLDVRTPSAVREIIMKEVTAWREVFQQRRMAVSLERMAERGASRLGPSVADELSKLKELLDQGVITREEYEKLKRRIVEGG